MLDLGTRTWLTTPAKRGGNVRQHRSSRNCLPSQAQAAARITKASSADIGLQRGGRKSAAIAAQPVTPIGREKDGIERSHSCSLDQRRRPETLRTAMATAFFCPTRTTSRLPRVTPVYRRFRCNMA